MEVYKNYEPLGEIQSELLCRYALNRLITDLEKMREDYDRAKSDLDLNDRNVGKIFGASEVTSFVLNLIREYFRDYLRERKENE